MNTHTVSLWLNNDEGLYNTCLDCAKRTDNAYEVGQLIRDLIEENKPEVTGLYSDLLTHALQNVDWREIGEDFYSEAHENDEEEEQE